MHQVIMLGTGNGSTMDLYNTCFVIKDNKDNFLVDTGGSIEVLKRLQKVDIGLKDVNHVFISHSHTDHLFGLIWLIKKQTAEFIDGKINHGMNIYCNDVVYDTIIAVSKHVLPERLVKVFLDITHFHVLKDGDQEEINGIKYTFFDIKARGTKQFGLECNINNKKLVFLGDEPLNDQLYERVRNSDYVMHEAFCLDKEEHIFHAYQKNHSTAKSACEVMDKLNVSNLILYHTEEKHGIERKKLYTEEGKKYFKGNVIVPDDLEVIDIV